MNADNKLTSIIVAVIVTLFPTKITDIFIVFEDVVNY